MIIQEIKISELKPYEKNARIHPAMKPVGLIEKIWLWHKCPEGIVADLYLGSGSTLIACEKTNRICYGMELDEHYVSIICQRFFDYTGIEPIRQDGKKWSEIKTA